MDFEQTLIPARLIRRYKRFLADVTLEDGREVTVHCANPGSMMGLQKPGTRIWLEPNDNPSRKLNYSWKLVELDGGHMAGIDTALPNRIVGEALDRGEIPELSNYPLVRSEVRYGNASRIDFLLSASGKPDAYVEVKNVTLSRQPGLAEFPDSVTKRGTKHLHDLARMAADGYRAVMFYLVQRSDCSRFSLAEDIDPDYAEAYRAAKLAGVETLCYEAALSTESVKLGTPMEIDAGDSV
jgi:sugar fermentation stimulation protein A